MGMEIQGADSAAVQAKVIKSDMEEQLDFAEKEARATAKERAEAVDFGMDSATDEAAAAAGEVDHAAARMSAAEEWSTRHTLYFVRFRPYEDPTLREKLDRACKVVEGFHTTMNDIVVKRRELRAEREKLFEELDPLRKNRDEYGGQMNEKLDRLRPLRSELGSLRSGTREMNSKGAGLCSSEEELNRLIKSLNYRISHETISLDEEKRLLREIKQLEGTRSKVVAIAAERAKFQDTVAVRSQGIQEEYNQIDSTIPEIRRSREEIKAKMAPIEAKVSALKAEIDALTAEHDALNVKKNQAVAVREDLKKQLDAPNLGFKQNRMLLVKAKDDAAKGKVEELKERCTTHVEKFMEDWCSSKEFRQDYERRILMSLNNRQLCRDGRMRNPDEKPIETESAAPADKEAAAPPAKLPAAKPAKEAAADRESAEVEATDNVKSGEGNDEVEAVIVPPPKAKEKETIDPEKLKEMKREEEIAKNKLALERKKKAAEKKAAQAAARAEKEAEKKQKEKEKRVKKKAAASTSGTPEEEQTGEGNSEEQSEEAKEELDSSPAVVVKAAREQSESSTRKRGTKAAATQKPQVAKVILKRKKTQAYWSWAAPAAAVAAVLVMALLAFGYYRYYYLPASN